jgi:hypothetical protein
MDYPHRRTFINLCRHGPHYRLTLKLRGYKICTLKSRHTVWSVGGTQNLELDLWMRPQMTVICVNTPAVGATRWSVGQRIIDDPSSVLWIEHIVCCRVWVRAHVLCRWMWLGKVVCSYGHVREYKNKESWFKCNSVVIRSWHVLTYRLVIGVSCYGLEKGKLLFLACLFRMRRIVRKLSAYTIIDFWQFIAVITWMQDARGVSFATVSLQNHPNSPHHATECS